jgi:hypothetical protein
LGACCGYKGMGKDEKEKKPKRKFDKEYPEWP